MSKPSASTYIANVKTISTNGFNVAERRGKSSEYHRKLVSAAQMTEIAFVAGGLDEVDNLLACMVSCDADAVVLEEVRRIRRGIILHS